MQQPTQKSHLHFLLSRTDNIGDVILTLPMAYLLKEHFPDSRIIFLARDYVKAIIEACPAIDQFLSWDTLQKQTPQENVTLVKSYNIDIAIHVFPRKEIAQLISKADIPYRIGTSHRWYHYFYCNRRINLNRKKSQLHEAQLNLKLLQFLGITKPYSLAILKQLVKLSPTEIPLPKNVSALLKNIPKTKSRVNKGAERHIHQSNGGHATLSPPYEGDVQKKFNLIVHPLSNNNGKEWPLEYYQALINALPANQFNIFITGAPNEADTLKPLIDACPNAHSVCGQLNLNEFVEFIRQCDGLLAGSTGPLHIASALGIQTLGLYPPPQTMNPARWAPIGLHANYLVTKSDCIKACFMPEGRTCACMKMITVEKVKKILLSWEKP